jgi:hypothetical protein
MWVAGVVMPAFEEESLRATRLFLFDSRMADCRPFIGFSLGVIADVLRVFHIAPGLPGD